MEGPVSPHHVDPQALAARRGAWNDSNVDHQVVDGPILATEIVRLRDRSESREHAFRIGAVMVGRAGKRPAIAITEPGVESDSERARGTYRTPGNAVR